MSEEDTVGQQVRPAEDQCGRRCTGIAAIVFAIVSAVVLLPILAVCIVALLPPAVPDRIPPSAKNLGKIGAAMRSYEAKYGRFPPAYTVDEHGRRMHSWRVLILEFLDPDLYAKYDFSQPWDSPTNLAFAKMMKKDGPYQSPNEDPKDVPWTSYVMLVRHGLFLPVQPDESGRRSPTVWRRRSQSSKCHPQALCGRHRTI